MLNCSSKQYVLVHLINLMQKSCVKKIAECYSKKFVYYVKNSFKLGQKSSVKHLECLEWLIFQNSRFVSRIMFGLNFSMNSVIIKDRSFISERK